MEKLLQKAKEAGHEEALQEFLWLVNADPDLTALPMVSQNVLEVIHTAKRVWGTDCDPEWGFDAWQKALAWVVQEKDSLVQAVGPEFAAVFTESGRHPLMGCIKRHSVYGTMCNSDPRKEQEHNFRLLQAHLLVAQVVLMRRHHPDPLKRSLTSSGDPLHTHADPYEAALAVRRFSADPLLDVITHLPVQLLPNRFVVAVTEITLNNREAIRRVGHLRVFLEKAFRERKQKQRNPGFGGSGGSGEWIDGGKTEFECRIVDHDNGNEPSAESGSSRRHPVFLRQSNRVTLTRAQMNELLDLDDYPFEDMDEEEVVAAGHDDPGFAREPGDFQEASGAWANHVEMANQLFPWSYGHLITAELRDLLVNLPRELLSAAGSRFLTRKEIAELEVLALAQVMFWTSSTVERACNIRFLKHRGASGNVDLALVPGSGSQPHRWRLRPILPRCRRPQVLDTRGMDRQRDDFLELPDIAFGSRLLLEFIRHQEISSPRSSARIFRKPLKWYKQHLDEILRTVSSDPRVTNTAIANFMMQRILIRAKGDLTATAMISGRDIPLARVRLFYACRSVQKLQELYLAEVAALSRDLDSDRKCIRRSQAAVANRYIGHRQCPTLDAVRNAVCGVIGALVAASQRLNDEQSRRYHNLYTLYSIWMFSYCTGIRGVRTPYLSDADIDPASGLCTIADKDGGIGYKTKLVWIPPQLQTQMDFYRDFLSRSPKLTDAGKLACFFVDGQMSPVEVSPQSIEPFMHEFLPFPVNIHRRFVSSELLDRGCPPEVVSAWMGHWHRGEEPWNRFSSFSFREYRDLLNRYLGSLLFEDLKFRPVHAW